MKKTINDFLNESKHWQAEIQYLRTIAKKLKLVEELKWGKPCLCFNECNIAIIQPFKNYLGLMFFKGQLLKDPQKILVANGPNSQAASRLEFTSLAEIKKNEKFIKAYLKEAVKIEQAGLKVEFKKQPEAMPPELRQVFRKEPSFKKAFLALTPGRQRAYILFFSAAKQSATRITRIEKFKKKIMSGKGITE
jgi:uncharacterized protein YdeI (YjbR/CyaY-like superfamily)